MDSLCKQNLAVNVDMELLKVCFLWFKPQPPSPPIPVIVKLAGH